MHANNCVEKQDGNDWTSVKYFLLHTRSTIQLCIDLSVTSYMTHNEWFETIVDVKLKDAFENDHLNIIKSWPQTVFLNMHDLKINDINNQLNAGFENW